MLILNALIIDKRFRMGLNYVKATIQAYQRGSRINIDIQFPLDLEIYEIEVTIDERSDNYTSGDNATPLKVVNLYASGNKVRRLEVQEVESIRAMRKREHTQPVTRQKSRYKIELIDPPKTRKCAKHTMVWDTASQIQK